MPLFETIEINKDKVAQLAKENWGIELGDVIKASQNHTFLAKKGEQKFILRVTPDPKGIREKCTELEMSLLEYLYENKLPVSPPVRSILNNSPMLVVKDDNNPLIMCLFHFATGEPVVYTEWKWLETKEIVVGLGQWYAKLHQLIRKFQVEFPEICKSARMWDTLHDSILKGVEIDPLDQAVVTDPNQFMIIHGDVNPSNYFWDSSLKMPSMFDWDQLQRAWYLYDLSSCIWGVVTLKKAGSPIDRSPVPQADPDLYTNWLLEGYESIPGIEKVDRAALERMVLIRRQLYLRFCKKALDELPSDHPMADFCRFMTNFFENEDKENQKSK
ncbi:hypothetical protein DLAC_08235 [Tieghemostelium lacteum]|uniref:Aminoglycoside phosphotransferase domain-containing protein n=1 Tax=Tieghemostelium lacteum TaxID=361077 RepID=A0A151ZBI9_TIELA|nr:hypothetical protein DLAC_08235 [Tieghemostelium lacteum]|eukprot:KYQ91295.1 hypothetical protein DLAC_08235 [Tieghemostelium lacteum]